MLVLPKKLNKKLFKHWNWVNKWAGLVLLSGMVSTKKETLLYTIACGSCFTAAT